MEGDAASFARLAGELHSAADEPLTAARIVELAVSSIPEVNHASLTVKVRRGRFRSLGATAGPVAEADAAQHQLEEGPCVDAVQAGDWFRSGDLARDQRWPRWGPRAAEVGLGSLLGVPLVGGREPAASLNLYAVEPGRFVDVDVVSHALLFGTHAALALQSAREISGLQTAVASRHLIGLAQGVLMERHGLSVEGAFAKLQEISAGTNRKLRLVAEDVLADRDQRR